MGRSGLGREFFNQAVGPFRTGLGNTQAGLIFSQRSKYCPPYFNTGNLVMSWELGLPRNLCLGGWGKEEHGYLAFFLSVGKPELLVHQP